MVRKLYPKFLLCLTLCCLTQGAFANTPLVIEITEGIDQVPVETGDVDQQINTSFVQNIEAEDIRDTQLGLAQVIQNQSGIQVRQIGGLGSQALVSIRGKSSDQVMIYLDGMLLNNAAGGSVDLSHINASQIARVEIYKDVVPVEFSQASNGGVINIITHRGSQIARTTFNAGLGSFSTQKANFSVANFYNNWQYVLTGNHVNSVNNFPFVNENGTFHNPDDDETQNRNNNNFSQQSLLGKIVQKISDTRTIQYQAEVQRNVKHIPSTNNSVQTKSNLSVDNQAFQLAYSDKNLAYNKLEMKMAFKGGTKKTIYDDSDRYIGLDKKLITQDIQLIESGAFLKFNQNRYQIINRTDLRYESLVLDDAFEPDANKSNVRRTLSSALQSNIYFFNKKLIVSPATRYFLSLDDFSGNTFTESGFNNQLEKTYDTFASQVGLRYQFSNKFQFKTNAGQYYRLPNYIELFGARGYIGSNETLKPENGINFDIGFELSNIVLSNTFTGINWDLSAFHSIIEDEISYSFNARGEGKPSNNLSSTISGLEQNLSVELFFDTKIVSNTTLQLPLNKSALDNVKLLAGRPLWLQTTRFEHTQDKWNFFLEHNWESSYYFDTEQRLLNPAKMILSSGFDYQVKSLKLSYEFNNILEEEYKDYYFQVAPGRYMIFSLNYQFD